MALEHEYTLLGGWSRSNVGRWIGVAAGAAASATVFLTLGAVNLARTLGWSPALPPLILWPLGAGMWYVAIYWVFDRYAWKFKPLAAVLRVPDLSDTWDCEGRSLDAQKNVLYAWSGTVTIWQSWDKLKVRLATAQSGSQSISAALLFDPTEGYRLMYHYRNDPRVDQGELTTHRGFSEIVFASNCETAEGEYFNGHGRYTFGTMKLTRRKRR